MTVTKIILLILEILEVNLTVNVYIMISYLIAIPSTIWVDVLTISVKFRKSSSPADKVFSSITKQSYGCTFPG